MTKPTIYIPNAGCHDFSPAEKFGTLLPVTRGKFNLISVGRIYRTLLPQLLKSTPEDFILVCGPTIINIIACGIFLLLHNRLNLLLYQIGRDGIGRYKRRNIHFNLSEDFSNE